MKLKRKLVAAAFRSMAGGVDEKSAFASTVAYYRASSQIRGQTPKPADA